MSRLRSLTKEVMFFGGVGLCIMHNVSLCVVFYVSSFKDIFWEGISGEEMPFNQSKKKHGHCNAGVPQGPGLAPPLFVVYISMKFPLS